MRLESRRAGGPTLPEGSALRECSRVRKPCPHVSANPAAGGLLRLLERSCAQEAPVWDAGCVLRAWKAQILEHQVFAFLLQNNMSVWEGSKCFSWRN